MKQAIIFLAAILTSGLSAEAPAPEPLPSAHQFCFGLETLENRALQKVFHDGSKKSFWDEDRPAGSYIRKYRANMTGLRFGYDYISPDTVYVGAHVLFAGGYSTVSDDNVFAKLFKGIGHTIAPWDPNSYFGNAEGRIGYTFKTFISPRNTFIPFVGGGEYFLNLDHHRQNQTYIAMGLRSNFSFTQSMDVGAQFKVIYLWNDNWGYEASLPLTWKWGKAQQWNFQLEPYILRLNTRLTTDLICSEMWGARLLFGYHF